MKYIICTVILMAIYRLPVHDGKPSIIDDHQLPVHIFEASANDDHKPLAIIFSGDGGWKPFVNSLALNLSKRGIPVVGVDALKYFWKASTPQATSKDIDDLLKIYQSKWNKKEVIFIGYSFGAGVVPFIVNGLSEPSRTQVSKVVLMSPADYADFEFHFVNWLGQSGSKDYPVMEEIKKLDGKQVYCFYGQDEVNHMQPLQESKLLSVTTVAGGHHYETDIENLVNIFIPD